MMYGTKGQLQHLQLTVRKLYQQFIKSVPKYFHLNVRVLIRFLTSCVFVVHLQSVLSVLFIDFDDSIRKKLLFFFLLKKLALNDSATYSMHLFLNIFFFIENVEKKNATDSNI